MGWKDWPSWMKGGVVGGIIGIVLSIISKICLSKTSDFGSIICIPFTPGLLVAEESFSITIANIILPILIFAIIGFIKDFIKSEKQIEDLSVTRNLYKRPTEGSYIKGIFISFILYFIFLYVLHIIIAYVALYNDTAVSSYDNINSYIIFILFPLIMIILSFFFVKNIKTKVGVYSFLGGSIINVILSSIIFYSPLIFLRGSSIYFFISCFIFGFIISFIYEKIKSKNQTQQLNQNINI